MSDDHAELICPLNQSFVDALGRRLACTDVHAVPVDRGTGCCVALRPTS